MRDILTAPWMVEMIRTVTNMYDHGWNERNGGNVSLLLEEPQVKEYVDSAVLREIPTGFSCPARGLFAVLADPAGPRGPGAYARRAAGWLRRGAALRDRGQDRPAVCR